MRKFFGSVSMLLACSTAFADEWIVTAGNAATEFSIQKGSFSVTRNKAGAEVAVVTARIVDKKTTEITLQKWYVAAADCAAGQGKLVTLSLSGEYRYENDFLFGGGSVASSNAKFICDVLAYDREEKRKKSL